MNASRDAAAPSPDRLRGFVRALQDAIGGRGRRDCPACGPLPDEAYDSGRLDEGGWPERLGMVPAWGERGERVPLYLCGACGQPWSYRYHHEWYVTGSEDEEELRRLDEEGLGAMAAGLTDHGWTPLHHAASWDAAEIAVGLIARGADREARGPYGRTPLHQAIVRRADRGALALLAAGADIEAVDEGGHDALLLAVRCGHHAALRALLAAGANPNARFEPAGLRPLMLVPPESSPSIAEDLLAAGAHPTWPEDDGCVPLLHAVRHGDRSLVSLLVAAGADPLCRDEHGRGLETVAREKGHGELLPLPAPPVPRPLLFGPWRLEDGSWISACERPGARLLALRATDRRVLARATLPLPLSGDPREVLRERLVIG